MVEQRALVPIGIVAPLVTVDEAVAEWERYLELCKRLLDKSDYQVIEGRRFQRKSGWRKLARAFNITDEIVEKEILRDAGQRVVSAEMLVRATAPNGRVAYGWGACSIHERAHEKDKENRRGETCTGPCNGRAHFSNPDHDVPATAHTRAKNRAISDLIGAGEVSAEEITSDWETMRTETSQLARDPGDFVIPRGKHADKTVRQVAAIDEGEDFNYLDFVLEKWDDEDLKAAIRAYREAPAQEQPEEIAEGAPEHKAQAAPKTEKISELHPTDSQLEGAWKNFQKIANDKPGIPYMEITAPLREKSAPEVTIAEVQKIGRALRAWKPEPSQEELAKAHDEEMAAGQVQEALAAEAEMAKDQDRERWEGEGGDARGSFEQGPVDF